MSANTGTDGEIDLDVEVTGSDDLLSWALKYRAIAVIGYLSLLLAFGKFTVEWWSRSPTLKRIVVPPAVFGGLLGLTCYWMLDSEPDLQNGLHGGLEEIIVNLICFVFTALILGFSSSGNYMMSPRGIVQSIWHEGIPMLLYSQVVLWGQTCVSLVVVCLYQALGTGVSPYVAPLVTMGLEAGRDIMPAEIVGGQWTWEVVGLADALGLCLAIAAGVCLISLRPWLGRTGWLGTHYLKARAELLPPAGHQEAFERGAGGGGGGGPGGPLLAQRAGLLLRSHSQGELLGGGGPRHRGGGGGGGGAAAVPISPDPHPRRAGDGGGGGLATPPERRPSLEALLSGHPVEDDDDLDLSRGGGGRRGAGGRGGGGAAAAAEADAGLGTHLSFVALSIFIAYAFNMGIRYMETQTEFFRVHHIMSGIRLFKLAMIVALVLMALVRRRARARFRGVWFHRLAGLCLDLLIIAAVSNLRFENLPRLFKAYGGIFPMIVLACVLWNAFVFVYLARRMFPNFWFERAVCLSGDALGHSWVGLLLVRALDPTLATPVPLAFAYKMMIFFVPGSGGKNAIVIGLIDTVGPLWSLGLSVVVIVCWLLIFQTYFRKLMPNHHSKKEKKDDPRAAHHLLTKSAVDAHGGGIELSQHGGGGGAAAAGAKPSHSDMDPLEGLRHKAELIDQSNILSDGHVEELAGALPAGERGRSWALAYSLRRDGACLRTLLYAVSVRRRASCLIVIEDSWGYVFGGYCGHRLENKQGYYGTGQSFVFGFHPAFRAFGWTGKNDLFAVSNESQLAMGGGGGFAFSLDGELDNGVSNRSETYGNPRLSSNEFFKCLNVEVWVFEEMAFGGAL